MITVLLCRCNRATELLQEVMQQNKQISTIMSELKYQNPDTSEATISTLRTRLEDIVKVHLNTYVYLYEIISTLFFQLETQFLLFIKRKLSRTNCSAFEKCFIYIWKVKSTNFLKVFSVFHIFFCTFGETYA